MDALTLVAHRAAVRWFDPVRFDDDPAKGGGAEGGDGGKGGPEGGDGGKAADTPKTFTQADIDRIVAERLKRQKDQFGDVEGYKAKAAKFDELDAANKTELEKAEARAVAAEKARDERTAVANERLIRAEVKDLAGTMNFVDLDAAVALIGRSDVKIDDSGVVTGVKEALDALAAAKPHLLKPAGPGGSADQGARGNGAVKDFRNATPEEFRAELGKHHMRPRSR